MEEGRGKGQGRGQDGIETKRHKTEGGRGKETDRRATPTKEHVVQGKPLEATVTTCPVPRA